jgi:hypothetical protein
VGDLVISPDPNSGRYKALKIDTGAMIERRLFIIGKTANWTCDESSEKPPETIQRGRQPGRCLRERSKGEQVVLLDCQFVSTVKGAPCLNGSTLVLGSQFRRYISLSIGDHA